MDFKFLEILVTFMLTKYYWCADLAFHIRHILYANNQSSDQHGHPLGLIHKGGCSLDVNNDFSHFDTECC